MTSDPGPLCVFTSPEPRKPAPLLRLSWWARGGDDGRCALFFVQGRVEVRCQFFPQQKKGAVSARCYCALKCVVALCCWGIVPCTTRKMNSTRNCTIKNANAVPLSGGETPKLAGFLLRPERQISRRCWSSGRTSKYNYFFGRGRFFFARKREILLCFCAFGGCFCVFFGVFVLLGVFFVFRASARFFWGS